MEEKNFLQKGTKSFSVFTSVLIGLALIVLVVIGLMGGNFLSFSVIGSSVVVFVVSIFMGAIQIKVFNNYKSQKKYLCADGIFYICLTTLVAISALIFVLVPNAQVDIRNFIFVFALAFAIWKIITAIFGFKYKYYNAFAELIIATFWLISGIGVLLSAIQSTVEVGWYLMCISNYLLGAATIFYILYSYVFKTPDYLITDEALKILEKEENERQQRLNRFNNRVVVTTNESTKKETDLDLEQKLNKLKDLKDKGFIDESEYEKRKSKLLDQEI